MKLLVAFEFDAIFPGKQNSRTSNVMFLVEKIIESLEDHSCEIDDQDLWMDCGWYIEFSLNKNQYNIFVAKFEDDEQWQLLFELESYYGFFGRLFGNKNIEYRPDAILITNMIFALLENLDSVSDIHITHANNTKLTVNEPKYLKWD